VKSAAGKICLKFPIMREAFTYGFLQFILVRFTKANLLQIFFSLSLDQFFRLKPPAPSHVVHFFLAFLRPIQLDQG
jgi:hypothetical protein